MSSVFRVSSRTGETLKLCSKCMQYKNLAEYDKDRTAKHGVVSQCKLCRSRSRGMRKSEEDRFWKYYHTHVEKIGDCLEWTGRYGNRGRPEFRKYKGQHYPQVRRLVYQLRNGELPRNMFVITTCRNVRCVRQSHLKAITRDEMEVIRCNSASQSTSIKLSAQAVRSIRARSEAGETKKSIARELGVSYQTVLRACNKSTWRIDEDRQSTLLQAPQDIAANA